MTKYTLEQYETAYDHMINACTTMEDREVAKHAVEIIINQLHKMMEVPVVDTKIYSDSSDADISHVMKSISS